MQAPLLQILGLRRVFRGFVGLEMEWLPEMESQRKEGMISSNMTKASGRIVNVRHGSVHGNTKKAWKSGDIRGAREMGPTGTVLANFC